jgi:ArsR family transcriptional regulator
MFDLANFDITRFEASAREAAKLLRALGNERRLMILCQLGDGERSVGELQPLVGLSQSALSQHLAVLREDGLVQARREAQAVVYSLAPGPARTLLDTLHGIYCAVPGARRG